MLKIENILVHDWFPNFFERWISFIKYWMGNPGNLRAKKMQISKNKRIFSGSLIAVEILAGIHDFGFDQVKFQQDCFVQGGLCIFVNRISKIILNIWFSILVTGFSFSISAPACCPHLFYMCLCFNFPWNIDSRKSSNSAFLFFGGFLEHTPNLAEGEGGFGYLITSST